MSDRTLVIINNAAARARRAWPCVENALIENGVHFDAHKTARRGDAEARTRAALREGYGTIAVVGGDGTLSEAASGFFEPCGPQDVEGFPSAVNSAAALAVLPSGTGDDFARGLMGRRAPLEKWLERLVAHCRRNGREGTTRPIDVLYGSVDGGARKFICLNAATLGIGAEVTGRVAAQKGSVRRLQGEVRFALAAVGALNVWRERDVRVRVDEHDVECATNMIAIVNGPYAGSGMKFSPLARTDDGQLDVLVACRFSRAQIVRELTRIYRGGHLANPKVHLARGTRVRVETTGDELPLEADGDMRGHTPAEFRVVPGALRIVW